MRSPRLRERGSGLRRRSAAGLADAGARDRGRHFGPGLAVNFCAGPWQRLGGWRARLGGLAGSGWPLLEAFLVGLLGGERVQSALGAGEARTGAGGDWGFWDLVERPGIFQYPPLPPIQSEIPGGQEGGVETPRCLDENAGSN